MGTLKVDGGTVRSSGDGSGGGAISTGSGKGTEDSPHIHVTTSIDEEGNPSDPHTTVRVEDKEASA